MKKQFLYSFCGARSVWQKSQPKKATHRIDVDSQEQIIQQKLDLLS